MYLFGRKFKRERRPARDSPSAQRFRPGCEQASFPNLKVDRAPLYCFAAILRHARKSDSLAQPRTLSPPEATRPSRLWDRRRQHSIYMGESCVREQTAVVSARTRATSMTRIGYTIAAVLFLAGASAMAQRSATAAKDAKHPLCVLSGGAVWS